MWIFDSYYKAAYNSGAVKEVFPRRAPFPPSFYMYLKDPSAHWEMIEALESRHKVEECRFSTIFGEFEGHRIYASRARRYGLEPTFNRSVWFKSMASKSYWSYGKVNHTDGALIPEGRALIDTAKSFVYTEGGHFR